MLRLLSVLVSKAQRNREEHSEQPAANRRSKRALAAVAQRELKKSAAAAEAAKRKKQRELQKQQAQEARELARAAQHNRQVDIFASRRGTRLVRAVQRSGDDTTPAQPSHAPANRNYSELMQQVMTELESTQAVNNMLQQQLDQATSAKHRLELDIEESASSKRKHVDHTMG